MQTAASATSPSMPLTSSDVRERAELWVYRIGGFLLINVIDDPAWLALMFC